MSPPLFPLSTTVQGSQRRRSEPASQNHTEIIFLCDSNGKYVDMKRLFPGRRSKKIWSPTTSEAMKKLATTDLQGVKHILIHTGTNDLTHNKDITRSLRQVAEKATSVAPTARVTISTLLPRRDVPQHEINKINADISKACTGIPNVHMAHHAEILYQHLYDSLHLNQSGVRLFIKDIKDTALDRTRSTSHISNKSTPNHQNLHRRSQHTRDTTNNGQSSSRRFRPASTPPLQKPSTTPPLYTSAPPVQDHHPTVPHYFPPLPPPLHGPSTTPLLYTSAPPPQDHHPTAAHHASWRQQRQQQPAQSQIQSPAQRNSYEAAAARLTTSPTELSLKQIRDIATLLYTKLLSE